ncbi:hypothetical protein T492DRAFT_881465 [Pavlovales sp. CCMP2436]|nr:hypothetical protein T492DRAFT_881465 [Pavlovales sp. CCMP2436]
MSDPPVAKAAEPEPDAIELRENEPASTDPASHTRQFELASTEIVELAGTEIDLGRLHLGGFSDHLADVLALLVAESKKHAQTLTVMQAWSSHLEQQVEDPNPSLQQRADTWRARQGFGPWKTDWIAHKRVSRVKAMMMGRRTAGANLRYAFVAWRWWHTASVRLEDLLAWVADERLSRPRQSPPSAQKHFSCAPA